MTMLIEERKVLPAGHARLLVPSCQLPGELLLPAGLPGVGMLGTAQHQGQSYRKRQPALTHSTLLCLLAMPCRLRRLGSENHGGMSPKSSFK